MHDEVLTTISKFLGAQAFPTDDLEGKWDMDSLDVIELNLMLEEEFGVTNNDAEIALWRTVGDVMATVKKAMEAKDGK